MCLLVREPNEHLLVHDTLDKKGYTTTKYSEKIFVVFGG